MSLHVTTVIDGRYGENAYVVWRQEGGGCWIVDPSFPPSPQKLIAQIEARRLTPQALILTHGHLDHIAGVPDIREKWPALPIYISNDARPALVDPQENMSAGVGMALTVGAFDTLDLSEGMTLSLDGLEWRIIDTSGHAPGSRSLYCEQAGIVIVGDALFQGSIGRVDFHHSDGRELLKNIREKLFALPDKTVVYSGHGPTTTIGAEKVMNPFVGAGADVDFEDM